MTRKGWSGLTIKIKTYEKFHKALENSRKKDPKLEVSDFILKLLEAYESGK